MTALAAIVVAAMATTACNSSSGGTGGEKTLIVGVDLPFQGSSKDASDSTFKAMNLYLEQVSGKAGKYKVQLKQYDDSTAAKGAWDDATCAKNAQDHVANTNEVAVMGTYNSGCAKIEVPVLNQATGGALLMVSHANTNPGLTKTWDPGEPDKYYPSSKRNYARVVATDDFQGAAAAQFAAKDLKVTKCAVLNDKQTYGEGVAKAFVSEAAKQHITVTSNQGWDNKQPNYAALFTSIKAGSPDCVFVGGIAENNGGQLIKDKIRILGDNNAVKLIAPDGFVGQDVVQKLPDAAGMYMTFPGLSTESLRAVGGGGQKLLDAYKSKYGSDPSTPYALYGVQALQVILAAIEKSDGTRKGVNDAVFGGEAVTISASTAVLGKDVKIDPKSGDVNVIDFSILLEKDGKDSFLKAWPVST
jgi:branched-chain amino acid transport system substrate-binding protein